MGCGGISVSGSTRVRVLFAWQSAFWSLLFLCVVGLGSAAAIFHMEKSKHNASIASILLGEIGYDLDFLDAHGTELDAEAKNELKRRVADNVALLAGLGIEVDRLRHPDAFVVCRLVRKREAVLSWLRREYGPLAAHLDSFLVATADSIEEYDGFYGIEALRSCSLE